MRRRTESILLPTSYSCSSVRWCGSPPAVFRHSRPDVRSTLPS